MSSNMKTLTLSALAAISMFDAAIAAPARQHKGRQIPGLGGSGTGTIPSISIPSGIFPTGLPGTSGIPGLGGSGSGGLGSIPGLGGSTGSSSGLGSLGGLSGLGSGSTTLPGLTERSGVTSGATPTTTSTGGLGGLGGLGSLGGLTGASTGSDTENDVVNNAGCTEMTVIFARGTSETGNVGTIAGPPMLSAIESSLGTNITKQGVDYPASIEGNADLGADGGPTMAKLVTQALSQCPDSKIIISGYSQGAMVVHNAATQSDFPASSISGAILFGDPENGSAVQGIDSSKLKEICASGDELCSGGGIVITPAHLTYGNDAGEAASFAISAAGL